MESLTWYLVIAVVLLGFVIGAGIALMRGRGSTTSAPDKPRPGIDYAPGVGDDDSVPRDTPRRSVTDVATSVLDEPETDADAEEAVTTEAVSTEAVSTEAVWEV
ncbi:MAG: signal recognition particle-docking protein FtsY, partial [Actinomycetota bacterium]|nr:signal recognition particle-docking protein FtsY [Actinomycetota bacterium]